MRLRSIALSIALGAIAVTGVWARQAGPAQLALEAARKVEVVDRDLKSAVVRYRDVVSTYPKDRAVVPEALLALAGCLEQLGQPEAHATYERVVKEYPNTAPARAAQKKLASLGKEGSGFSIGEVDGDNTGAPSLDGGYMSFTDHDTGDLAVRDLKTGQARQVTTDGRIKGTDFAMVFASVPSPDGKQIAYRWGGGSTDELRVISSRGGPAKMICCADPNGTLNDFELHGWSRDSKQILVSLDGTRDTTQIVTLPAAGGVPRVLKTVAGSFRSVKRASWSPDGQFIIYDAPRVAGAPEHALFIMRADGSNSAVLIPSASDDKLLDWFPDGKRILFVSDRMGTYAAFTQTVADGKAVGDPSYVGETLGYNNVEGQGFARDGSYHYRTRGYIDDILTFKLNAAGSVSGKAVRLLSRIATGRQGAALSPDGSQIAYVQTPFILGARPSLSIQSVATGRIGTVSVELAAVANPAWMPDSLAIIVEGVTARGGQGLFRIEPGNGSVTPIGETTTAATGKRQRPVVSLDGREVLYLLGLKSVQARSLSSGIVRVVLEGSAFMDLALSPDGRSIAVAVDTRGQGKAVPPVQIVPLAGGAPRGLGPETDGYTGPGIAWSPDGTWVWFTRYGDPVRAPGMPLWRVPTDGGPAQHMSALWPLRLGIRRLSAAPDGSMATSAQTWSDQQWVMRNIPPIAR